MDPLNNLQFSDTQTRERLIRLRSDCETAERNVREFEKVVSDEKAVGEELRADLKEQTKEINHIEHGVTRTFQQINYVKAIRSEISKRSTASPSASDFDPQAFSDELAMIKTTIAQSKINIEELRREVEEKTRLAVEQRLEERENVSESESEGGER
ncbi:hypothetical protein TL16_g12201 [Triparma laevis f. inornata]|uniref:Uncharacterized protein n=1 Tax=Triparma laevis f. inornata TaxID=1714386 RepID=A0A9W7ET97_9STRA|nr:hypothetical protein TL16_g12201 [Triparma laevis f. inornata]